MVITLIILECLIVMRPSSTISASLRLVVGGDVPHLSQSSRTDIATCPRPTTTLLPRIKDTLPSSLHSASRSRSMKHIGLLNRSPK